MNNNPIRAVLVGAMGAGRTSVGRELASKLGVQLSETEDVVAAAVDVPFSTFVLRAGGAELSQTVVGCAHRQLGPGEPARVVTLVPSALADESIRERLLALSQQHVPVVALDAPGSELARRSGLGAPRSLALGQPRGMFQRMVAELREQFLAVGATEVSTMGRVPEEVAAQLVQEFTLD